MLSFSGTSWKTCRRVNPDSHTTSQAHSDCSESFYKKEIANGIDTEPSKSAEERLKMLEILKRFEEDNLEDEGIFDEEEEVDNNDDFEDRFQGIDIENAAYEDIWERLKEDERKRFIKAIDNPDSDLRRDFVLSEEHCKPWWEGHLEGESAELQKAAHPTPMRVPLTMVKATSIPTGPPLIYNFIAYAFATRHLNASPLANGPERDAKEIVEQLVPFLTEKKSTILHTDLDGVGLISNRTMSILLRDAAHLIRSRPPIVLLSQSEFGAPEPGYADIESQPNRYLVCVLSDLQHIYATSKHITHKLLFYASHILSTPSAVFQSLAVDLEDRSKEFGRVGNEVNSEPITAADTTGLGHTGASETGRSRENQRKSFITEL
ncbi:hypothetical protein PQX77_008484 [Marasmius sp. AFHP31]|nr:hypothetical protein PQX77_008484 [Marasmius sp. AFHP31]